MPENFDWITLPPKVFPSRKVKLGCVSLPKSAKSPLSLRHNSSFCPRYLPSPRCLNADYASSFRVGLERGVVSACPAGYHLYARVFSATSMRPACGTALFSSVIAAHRWRHVRHHDVRCLLNVYALRLFTPLSSLSSKPPFGLLPRVMCFRLPALDYVDAQRREEHSRRDVLSQPTCSVLLAADD